MPTHREHARPEPLVPPRHAQALGGAARERGVEVGRGHPPRLPDRGLAAGHRHRREATAPLEACQVGDQELAAPDRAVGAVAGAVEGHPDDRAVRPVVGQAGGDVRVVVLDAGQLHAGELGAGQLHAGQLGVSEILVRKIDRVLGGQVLGMQVVGDHLGPDVEQPPEVLDPLGERAQRLGVLQVPDMVRHERVVLLGQAERVLQLGPAGQDRPGEPDAHAERFRHVAAGPPDHRLPAAEGPHDRVVGPDLDRAVVGEERVCDPGEPLRRLPVARGWSRASTRTAGSQLPGRCPRRGPPS